MAVNISRLREIVIADIIDHARPKFLQYSLGEEVVQQFKGLWERKLNDLDGNTGQASKISFVGELSTADLLFASPSPRTNQRTDPNPGPELDMNVASDDREEDEAGDIQDSVGKAVSPPIGKRKRDDIGDTMNMLWSREQAGKAQDASNKESVTTSVGIEQGEERRNLTDHATVQLVLPQLDGAYDVMEEDYNYPGEDNNGPGQENQEPQEDNNRPGQGKQELREDNNGPRQKNQKPRKRAKAKANVSAEGKEMEGKVLEDGPPLGEEDDLEDIDDILNAEARYKTDNIVCAQFEKVSRLRNKWRCILTDGIMNLHNQYYLFSTALGEFEF